MFTKIGRIVGFVVVALGLAAFIGSFFFPSDLLSPEFDRQSFNFRQSTLLFTQGSIMVFAGLVLGVLCEISLKLEK
ncbi:hypothetical protein [Celeribacter halophilus]|uniref:Uncharacterized protein n=1 Tax=Celeribacter halophilus TaxID=576117 RepID=A0A1I3R6N3_9RHOB|nr:hypothetical protein [Celeribacter halophilus]PZX05004.1 hypothetical protein LX82_03580 [Celeribacter halophilus]SFJ40906.1 hypothetical protein SAMN04488138_104257 [Celeribacter halophilus]